MKPIVMALLLFVISSVSQPVSAATCTPGDIKPPTVITDFQPVVVSNEGIIFAFTAPTDASGIAKYEFRYSKTAFTARSLATANWAMLISDAFETNIHQVGRQTGLSANTTYYAAIKSYDSCGNASVISNQIKFTTTAQSNNEILVFWPAIPKASSYSVYYGLKSRTDPQFYGYYDFETCIGTTNTSCKIALAAGKTYYVTVKALYLSGYSPFGNEVSVSFP